MKQWNLWSICSWIICLLLAGCTRQEESTKEKTEPYPEALNVTTDMVFHYAADSIPAGFVLDTFNYEDTAKKVSFACYYFKALGDSLKDYNQKMQAALTAEVLRELAYYEVEENPYILSSIENGPQEIYVGHHMVNTQFISDSYTDGGNHHNYSWFSLNYDRKTGKMLRFGNEFVLKTTEDSADFREIIGRNLDDHAVEIGNCCNDTIDFFVHGNRVEFGPYLSWADGLQTADLPLDSLVRFLNRGGVLWTLYKAGK